MCYVVSPSSSSCDDGGQRNALAILSVGVLGHLSQCCPSCDEESQGGGGGFDDYAGGIHFLVGGIADVLSALIARLCLSCQSIMVPTSQHGSLGI